MNFCADQLLLTLGPEQIRDEPVSRDAGNRGGDISRYPGYQEARGLLLINPDIVVASGSTSVATRELLKAQGAGLFDELALSTNLDEARQADREAANHRASRACGCGNRAARCGAGARPPRGLDRPLSRCCRVAARLGRGSTALSARCSAKRLAQRGGRSPFQLRRICLAGGDRKSAAGFHLGFQGRRHRSGRRPGVPAASALARFYPPEKAIVIPDRMTEVRRRAAGWLRWSS